MKLAARATLRSVALVLVLTLATSGCTGGGDDPSADPSASAPAQETEDATSFDIATRTTIGRQVGRLPRKARHRLEEQVTGVVQRWFNAAYVRGEYPRGDFHDAFPGFTSGARDRARQDRALMSNKRIGKKIDSVTPTRSRIWLDVLAVRKRAVGVTARFALAFTVTGKVAGDVEVRGRLMLSRQGGEWKIFGYDVARGGK